MPTFLPKWSSYTPLVQYLTNLQADKTTLTFAAVERILGRELPPSARKHTAWWSNSEKSPGHPWANLWLNAGWRTDGIDLRACRVTFCRFRTISQQLNKTVPSQEIGIDLEPADLSAEAYLRFTPEQLREIAPLHNCLSNRFKEWLAREGAKRIKVEQQRVDISCQYAAQSYLFELKTCAQQSTRQAIREALGQALEYGYYPGRTPPKYLAIVLDTVPSADDKAWVRRLNAAQIEMDLFWVINGVIFSARLTKNPLAERASQG